MSNNIETTRQMIKDGGLSIGIEFGSTRIKTVAIDKDCQTIATGSFEWENQFLNGYWTYSINDVWVGLQKSYREMADKIKNDFNTTIRRVKSLGISGMMHGYLAFDEKDDLLVPFRTWRNNNANEAAGILSQAFGVNIPERWSIAQLFQSALEDAPHTSQVRYMTTLSGFVHWYLTDERVLGVGDASGMFPIDPETGSFREDLLDQFNTLFKEKGFNQDVHQLLPRVLSAGENAGYLTAEGARLIDSANELEAGAPLCAPEGDAATGMVATNSVAPRTGNVSAGTSIFSMIVLDHPLKRVYPEVDLVTTPAGHEVAMIHANNCTSDINAWIDLFAEVLDAMGATYTKDELFTRMFETALTGDPDLGRLLSYGYVSGEFITDVPKGFPMLIRDVDSKFNLANVMKTHIFSAFSTLKIGIDLLKRNEGMEIENMVGHGGIFKTERVAQSFLAAALESPVSVMKTASEGGAWGIAVLARYLIDVQPDLTLADYLQKKAFGEGAALIIAPKPEDVESFREYITKFEAGLPVERSANDYLN
ncbi:xylulokinase [Staphylococcus debuckii]|uniref:xylulokinase n=1 Tax=Staphylococcus debuckii TaxID=2044912 RepID=UPI000F43319E|nr:FGGY-family carbohydrate kinase [Staphylococcus debuckii]AYU54465.1 ATPase [Staphylococcus debuckii]